MTEMELAVEELQQLYSSNIMGLGVLDQSLKYLRVNARLAEVNGVSVNEHLGKTVRQVLPDLADDVEPMLRKVLEEKQEQRDVRVQGITPASPDTERAWNCHYFPLSDPSNTDRPAAIAMIVEEMTAVRQYERKMREERQALARLADAMPVMVLVLAHDLRLRFSNARWHDYLAAKGQSTGSEAGLEEEPDFLSFVHSDDRGLVAALFEGETTDTSSARCEARLRDGDGNYYWHLIESEHAGSMLGLSWEALVTCADISNQKLIQEKLRKRTQRLQEEDRRKDEFLGILGHELRNPLAAIRAAVDVLKGDEQDLKWASQVLDEQSALVARLIDDLLDEARIRNGKIRLQKSVMALNSLLELSVEAVRQSAEDKKISLAINSAPAGLGLRADSTRVQQILTNLLRNAVRYSANGGAVTISCEVDSNENVATFCVADQGRGIAPEMLERIFEPFIQIKTTNSYPKKGLGVGLSLVRTLVDLHMGSVEARSQGEGYGSEFLVTLPGVQTLTDEQIDLPPVVDSASAGARRILIVDDNQPARVGLMRVMDMKGFAVESAGDGQSALEMIDAQPFDVCILDIGLPDISGYELARAIRNRPWGPSALLVALTGYGHKESRSESRSAGFDHHLLKPADLARLLEWIGAHRVPGVGED